MDEQDRRRHEWAAPEGTPWADGSPPSAANPQEPDADGPPPPPWERRRARRRRLVSVLAVVALVLLLPLGLVWAGVFDRADGDSAAPTDGPTDGPTSTAPDERPEPDGDLAPPDADDFTGSDADFARVLAGIEASERTMMGFQRDLAETSDLAGSEDLAPFFAAVRDVAESNAEDLTAARGDLEVPLETPAADTVREVYLDHLDAWLTLMETAAVDPTVLGPTGETGRFDVEINATAVDFSRTLEDELPEDVDDEIARFARDLLDRGFRFDGEAQV